MADKIHTENIPGNLHEAATWINRRGWASNLITMHFNGGHYTVAVFRFHEIELHRIRHDNPSFMEDPAFDNHIMTGEPPF